MDTKILATIGPNSESPKVIEGMIRAGMNIARMNFSHCTFDEFLSRKRIITSLAKKLKKEVVIFQDLQGPRIRVGKMPEEGKMLEEGRIYIFSHKAPTNINGNFISIDDPYLHMDMKKGEPLYLANGVMELEVVSVKDKQIYAKCLRGGILFSRKAINIPLTKYGRGALTPKDIKDIKFGVKQGIDHVGLSFVQTADDVRKLRSYLGGKDIKIIAKIERAVALHNIDEIIQEADGIVVARGDLGIETAMEDLPIIQKNLIRHSHWHGKPVIVATQMMLSMIDHQTPTRAEVTDVANAVFEGADGVWLSDETANGKYPVETVRAMKKIISRIDQYKHRDNFFDVGDEFGVKKGKL